MTREDFPFHDNHIHYPSNHDPHTLLRDQFHENLQNRRNGALVDHKTHDIDLHMVHSDSRRHVDHGDSRSHVHQSDDGHRDDQSHDSHRDDQSHDGRRVCQSENGHVVDQNHDEDIHHHSDGLAPSETPCDDNAHHSDEQAQ